MKLPRKKRDETSATITHTLGLILACSVVCALTALGSPPAWWSSRGAVLAPVVTTNDGVVTTNYVPNDYDAVTQGQLKQFTARAVDELNADLTNYGGAGTNLNNLVYGWAQDYATNGYATNTANPTMPYKPSDLTAMNVGQLKSVAGLVYGRLSAVGYTELAPSWLHQNTNTDNVVANLGQLKQVFDFDLSLSSAGNLTATASASGTVNLNWTLPGTNNATSWLVEQQNSDGTWTVIATLNNPTTTSYSVTGLTNGQSYNFQIIGAGTNNVSLPISASGTPTSGSNAPIPSPGPGRYLSSQTITVTSTIDSATIYYTTDGTDPTTSSSSISNGGQLTVNANTLYKFIAVSGSSTSTETTALYRIDGSGDLEAGDSFTMVRKPDSTVWTWGDDSRGQQGDSGAHNPAAVPQQVPNLSGVTSVAAAGDHALAVTSSGSVWAWGADDQSQGGDGGTSDLLVSTQITGLSNIAAVYAGDLRGFAVDHSGNLYGWGTNDQGQLGDGTTTNESTPEAIKLSTGAPITGVVKVVAGPVHTLLLKSDGTVWASGSNYDGALGDGTYNNASYFQPVPGLTNVVDIAAGGGNGTGHSMALLANGSIETWGADWNGELGDGNFDGGTPAPETITLPSAVSVFAVDDKSFVVLADGTVRCFGGNFEGEMGIGNNTADQSFPVEPTGITNVSLLAAGSYHAVVCTSTGAFYGWGDNNYFKLTQDFNNFNRNSEVHDDSFQGFTSVASAENTTLGLKSDGTVWAVGQGSDGVLGQGGSNLGSMERPVQITSLSNIAQIAGGESDAFAIGNTGTLWAWGEDGQGQLGVGDATGATLNTPTQVQNVQNIIAVAAGDGHMLAVQSDGTVWATGDDTDGELGDGTTNSEAAPIQVVALSGITAQAVAAGSNTSFALDSNGLVWAWGKNDTGELGLGTTGDVNTPTQIATLPPMVAISARFGNGMGIDVYGNVWSWGVMGNSDGTPVEQLGLSNVTAIATGIGHQLALESDGSLWGWGWGGLGQLGNNYSNDTVPTQFADVQGAVAIAANYASTFLVKQDGTVSGFGYCLYGQLAADVGLYDYSPKSLFGIALNETPPTISITSPSAGASSPMGTAIQFQSSATASTGSITKVDYYLEGVKLGTSTTSGTWNFSYTPLSYGDYTFEAVATDSAGVETISAPITVNVSIASPTVAVASGNNQTGTSGAFLANPLVVSVTNSSGTPLANTTVTFSVAQGAGLVSTSTTASPSNSVQVTTDANGMATAYFKQPLVANYTSTISATSLNLAGQSVANFTATTPVDNGPPAAPTGLTVTNGAASGELDLTWTNNADNATSILIQQSTDGTNWTTVATLTDPTSTSYAATGLTVGDGFYYQVVAANNNGSGGTPAQSNPDATSNPTSALAVPRYIITDLGVGMNPLKITKSSLVLMSDDGGNYYRWENGVTTPLPGNVTDMSDDGTITTAGFIDDGDNVWSTNGNYNNSPIGNATGHWNPYPLLLEEEYEDSGAITGIYIGWVTGDSVIPLMVNGPGVGACSKTVYNTTTDSEEDYSGTLYPNIPTLEQFTRNAASTNSYFLSNHGSDSGTQIPFSPIALSNASGIIGPKNGPYVYWDPTMGNVNLPSSFTPGSVNAATTMINGASTPAYQILGNDSNGNLALLEMNPHTGLFPTTPTDITAYLPTDLPWCDFSAVFGFNASQVINDSGAIVGTATYTGTNYPTGSHGVMLWPLEQDLVNHDDLTQTWTANEQKQSGLVTVYAGTTTGDEVAWKLNAPSSWLGGTFTWTATDSNGTVINGPTGVGKDHWQISDTGGNDPASKTSLTWKPDTYTIKCNIAFSGGGTIPIQFTQKVGWRTEDYLVIGQIVTTHHYDNSAPQLADGSSDDFEEAVSYDVGDNISVAGSIISPWGLPASAGPALTTALINSSIGDNNFAVLDLGFWGSVAHGSVPQGPFGTSSPNNQGIVTADERWWMIQTGLNISVDDPSGAPATIPYSSTALKSLRLAGNYRMYQHYQTRFCLTSAGKIDTATIHDIHNRGALGGTKINFQIAAGTFTVAGISNPQIGPPPPIPAEVNPVNGTSIPFGPLNINFSVASALQTSADGTQHSAYISGRIGADGQDANWRLFGKDVPWIFSEIISQVASDHTVTGSIKLSVNQTWLTTGPVSGQHNFNNLNIYKAVQNPIDGTVSYTPQAGSPISMDGQVQPFIDSVPAGTWPNAPPTPSVQ